MPVRAGYFRTSVGKTIWASAMGCLLELSSRTCPFWVMISCALTKRGSPKMGSKQNRYFMVHLVFD